MFIMGTYNLVANPLWKNLVLQEIYLECDTTLAPVTINLFPISELKRFWNVKIYITDSSNNASVNPITINSGSSGVPLTADKINKDGVTSFVISDNGGDAVLSVANENSWSAFSQSSVNAYTTVQDKGTSLPQRNIIDFQGLGVVASDVGGKTVVTIPATLPSSNFGLFTQTAQGSHITNTVVESNLLGMGVGTLSVPPNGFSIGDSFQAIMTGHINSANNQGIEFRIKANSVLLADTGIITLSTATNRHFRLEVFFTVRSIGVSGVASIVSGGLFQYTKNASLTFEGADFSTEVSTGFDTTVLNTLDITAQWSSANPNNTIYSELFTLNKTY